MNEHLAEYNAGYLCSNSLRILIAKPRWCSKVISALSNPTDGILGYIRTYLCWPYKTGRNDSMKALYWYIVSVPKVLQSLILAQIKIVILMYLIWKSWKTCRYVNQILHFQYTELSAFWGSSTFFATVLLTSIALYTWHFMTFDHQLKVTGMYISVFLYRSIQSIRLIEALYTLLTGGPVKFDMESDVYFQKFLSGTSWLVCLLIMCWYC